jgi:hypothetical protein
VTDGAGAWELHKSRTSEIFSGCGVKQAWSKTRRCEESARTTIYCKMILRQNGGQSLSLKPRARNLRAATFFPHGSESHDGKALNFNNSCKLMVVGRNK